ncbi:hypothetical protein [Metabacillus sp. Hm71]|uniref:hypothetical protein n=1 Tax=Metabacillus sp. Hm71 TaxID=3450743 RepID=UPI003F43A033
MTVLEAIEKMNEIQAKIEALARVIMKLESDKEFNHELRILNGFKNELHDEKEKLQHRLEKSQLAPEVLTRGV